MWPDDFASWQEDCMQEALRYVIGRLQQYPVLSVFAQRTGEGAVARGLAIADWLRQHPHYFANWTEFCRWLRIVSYRESLRLVLQPESVEMARDRLPPADQAILRWRYIDQLNDEEMARMLDMRTKNRLLYDAVAARGRSLEVYVELCRLIAQRYSPAPVTGSQRIQEYTSVFPLFPNTCRDLAPPSSSGGEK